MSDTPNCPRCGAEYRKVDRHGYTRFACFSTEKDGVFSHTDDCTIRSLNRDLAAAQARVKELEAALNAILDNDGSRNVFSATRVWDARAKAEELLKEAKLAAITPIAATDDFMRSLDETVGEVRNDIRTETESPVWRTEFNETKP